MNSRIETAGKKKEGAIVTGQGEGEKENVCPKIITGPPAPRSRKEEKATLLMPEQGRKRNIPFYEMPTQRGRTLPIQWPRGKKER